LKATSPTTEDCAKQHADQAHQETKPDRPGRYVRQRQEQQRPEDGSVNDRMTSGPRDEASRRDSHGQGYRAVNDGGYDTDQPPSFGSQAQRRQGERRHCKKTHPLRRVSGKSIEERHESRHVKHPSD